MSSGAPSEHRADDACEGARAERSPPRLAKRQSFPNTRLLQNSSFEARPFSVRASAVRDREPRPSWSEASEGGDWPVKPDCDAAQMPDSPTDFRAWVHSCFSIAGSARVGLNAFIKQSKLPCDACTVEPLTPRGDSFPCPLGLPWKSRRWTPCKLSPRRRRRHRAHKLVNDMLFWVVGWHLWYFMRAEPLQGCTLGRCEEKFTHLLRVLRELPCMADAIADVDLTELVSALQREADPYTRPSADPAHKPPDLKPHPGSSQPGPLSGCGAASQPELQQPLDAGKLGVDLGSLDSAVEGAYKRVVASRIKWQCPPTFNPVPYLTDPIVRAAYKHPDSLRKPRIDWPRAKLAHVNCSRHELLQLAQKWDDVGALQIVRDCDIDETELVGLFSIPKDRDHDRLIVDPTTMNSRCHGYSKFTRLLAPGALLTQLHLSCDESACFSADDLTEMYTFQVTPARAVRNTVRMKFRASEVAHFRAFNPLLHVGTVYTCVWQPSRWEIRWPLRLPNSRIGMF